MLESTDLAPRYRELLNKACAECDKLRRQNAVLEARNQLLSAEVVRLHEEIDVALRVGCGVEEEL